MGKSRRGCAPKSSMRSRRRSPLVLYVLSCSCCLELKPVLSRSRRRALWRPAARHPRARARVHAHPHVQGPHIPTQTRTHVRTHKHTHTTVHPPTPRIRAPWLSADARPTSGRPEAAPLTREPRTQRTYPRLPRVQPLQGTLTLNPTLETLNPKL